MVQIRFEKGNNSAIAYDDKEKIGECNYIEVENCWNIIHTEVSKSYQGQGIARQLVECIIKNSKKYNKTLIADCSYAKKVIENNL